MNGIGQTIREMLEYPNILLYSIFLLLVINFALNVYLYLFLKYKQPRILGRLLGKKNSNNEGPDKIDVVRARTLNSVSTGSYNAKDEQNESETNTTANDRATAEWEQDEATQILNTMESKSKKQSPEQIDSLRQKKMLADYFATLKKTDYDDFISKWNPIGLRVQNLLSRANDSSYEPIFEEIIDFHQADFWGIPLRDSIYSALPAPRTQQYIESYHYTTGSGLYINGIYQVLDGTDFSIIEYAIIRNNEEKYCVDKIGTMILPQI